MTHICRRTWARLLCSSEGGQHHLLPSGPSSVVDAMHGMGSLQQLKADSSTSGLLLAPMT